MTSTVPASGPLPRSLRSGRPQESHPAKEATLQAVFLDMDGTLVDTEGFWWDVEVEVFASLGHRLDDSWRHVVVGGPMTRSAGFLLEATGADIPLAELAVLLNDGFEDRIADTLPLMPGAARLLAELSEYGVPTALVSASHRRVVDRVLTSLGPQHFALSVAGDEVPRTKPHPDPYLAAAGGLGVDPLWCAVVEDTVTGVASAEAAGCNVVVVPSAAPIEPTARRTVVSSLEGVDLTFLHALVSARSDDGGALDVDRA